MESTEGLDGCFARPDVQVIGIPQDDLCAGTLQLGRMQSAYSTVRPHRHEGRGFYRAVREQKGTGPRVGGRSMKGEFKHGSFLVGARRSS